METNNKDRLTMLELWYTRQEKTWLELTQKYTNNELTEDELGTFFHDVSLLTRAMEKNRRETTHLRDEMLIQGE